MNIPKDGRLYVVSKPEGWFISHNKIELPYIINWKSLFALNRDNILLLPTQNRINRLYCYLELMRGILARADYNPYIMNLVYDTFVYAKSNLKYLYFKEVRHRGLV